MKSKSNITAKNYASAAVSSVTKWLPLLSNPVYKKDVNILKKMVDELKSSVHFVMPDAGTLLDDNLGGIKDSQIRLPYPMISVEYYMPKGVGPDILDERFPLVDTYKRVILAKEHTISELQALPLNIDKSVFMGNDYVISIYAFFYSEEAKIWEPCPFGVIIPSKWYADKNSKPTLGKDYGRPGFLAMPVLMLPDLLGVASNRGYQEDLEAGMQDMGAEVMVVLELIEALTCSNVEESIYQEASKKNAQRIKSHKNPVWETKFLTLVVNEKSRNKGEVSSTTHASPRQHLRRGHIRRLPSKNIWVNSCVVGNTINGKIEKQYKVQK